jgi:MFS transporter, MFS domain-containing protein family, molybdate-anion transporter
VVGIIAAIANEQGGPTAPLKLSFALLVLGAIIIQVTWKENYGDQNSQLSSGVKDGFKVVLTNKNVALIGFMQSLFEGAMYTFVFMWTPALKNTTPFKPLLGWIFSAFMVCFLLDISFLKSCMNRWRLL